MRDSEDSNPNLVEDDEHEHHGKPSHSAHRISNSLDPSLLSCCAQST
jgi:hypothetical protein